MSNPVIGVAQRLRSEEPDKPPAKPGTKAGAKPRAKPTGRSRTQE
jgi:hypothetical protein